MLLEPMALMFDKVNVSSIVVDHIKTWKDYSSKKYHFIDFLLFLGLPLAITGIVVYFYGSVQPTLITILATSLSIFAALLFNLLLLVYDAMGKSQQLNGRSDKLRGCFLRELSSNISFAILVAIGAIVCVLALVLVKSNAVAENVISGIIYYFVSLFLLTLLMLLKRVHVLLKHEASTN